MKRRGRPRTPGVLTSREIEVLELLRQGLSNREIANRLGISLAGAKFHVSEIITKLGVSGREEAARWRPEFPILVPWLPDLRRLGAQRTVPLAAAGALLLVLALLLLANTRRGPAAPTSAVAPSASETPAPPESEFKQLASIDEVRALATFPVLTPAYIPDGFRITSIRYYKPGFRCPREVDPEYCARVHNDVLEVRYEAGSGLSFFFGQGYGGPASGGVTYGFAPPAFKGTVAIGGREAHWAKGHPRSGMVDPGGGQPVGESDWVSDSSVTLTWLESRDLNPTNTESPRCMSLFSQSMSLDELIAIAASVPDTTALRSTEGGC